MRRNRLNLWALRARRWPRVLRPGISATELLDENLTITRRGLLGFAGATAIALPMSAAADARPFQVIAGRKRVVFRVAGLDRWVIDTRWFAGAPRLTTTRRKGYVSVELENARYPGTNLPADFRAEIKLGPVGWQMRLNLSWGGFASRTPFGSWLAGEVAAHSRVSLQGEVCRMGNSASLATSGSAQAEFYPNWTLHLTGRGIARLLGVGGGATSDSLAVSLLAQGEASILTRPAEKRTLLAMARGDRGWPLLPDFGQPWQLATSDSSFDLIHIEAAESTEGEAYRAFLAESRSSMPSVWFAPGENFRGSDGQAFRLGLRNVRYAATFEGGQGQSALVADYDSKSTWLHAGGCSFEVGGGASAAPFDLTAIGNRVRRVRCAPPLRSIAAPLPGAVVRPGPVIPGTQLAFAFGSSEGQGRVKPKSQPVQLVPKYPVRGLEAPISSISVMRTDDLLSLDFNFYNLSLSIAGGIPNLVRQVSGQPAYLVANFAPQHVAEAAFQEPEQPQSLPAVAEPPVPARLAGPSRLAFLVPDSLTSIPYLLSSLLDWSKFEQSVTPLATPPPAQTLSLKLGPRLTRPAPEPTVPVAQKNVAYYQKVQPVMVEPSAAMKKSPKGKGKTTAAPVLAAAADLLKVKSPELYQTALELPYRLILSPSYYAGWAHALQAVTHSGRTELWHTRLGVRSQDGKIDEGNDYYRTVRAVWAQDYQAVCPSDVEDRPPFPPPNYLTSPSTLDRYQLVRLSSDPSLANGNNSAYSPVPVQVNRLMLSTLGGWLNVQGSWSPVDQGVHDPSCANSAFSLVEWDQIAAMGRDQYVRVITEGFLFPFGHRAVQIIVTERKFDRTPRTNQMGAYLRQRLYVVVKEHTKNYPAAGQLHPNGPKIPFQTVEIKTSSTPPLDTRQPLLNEDKNSSSPRAYYPRASGADFLFQLQGMDWEGNTCEFTTPLIYVDATIARIPSFANELIGIYGSGTANTDRRQRPLNGQKIAYAKNDQAGDTTFETNSLTFTAEAWDPEQPPARPQPYFYPALEQAEVRVATVEQLTGTSATTSIEYHPTYNQSGFNSSVNKGLVFAQMVNPVPLAFGAAGAGADKVGGLLTPTMTLSGLSRSLGVVAGNLANAVAGSFDPTDIFQDALNATLLGDISLMDVIAKVADFTGALNKVPKFVTTPTSDTVVTTFTWQPQINNVPATDSFFVVTGDKSSALTLNATLTTYLNNKPPTYQVNGSLKQFEIHLVPSVMELLVVSFNSISFSSQNGQKPDFSVDLDTLTFEGPLSFINALKDLIPLDGFKDPPNLDVTPDGIEMSYQLGLPPVGVGVFALSNLSLGAQLNIYFTNTPMSFEFDFCTEDQPFLLTVTFLGGGGFFGMAVSPKTGITRMAGGLDFGGSFSLDLGVASGSVYALAGVAYSYDQSSGSALTGYLKLGGSLDVLGIITVSVEFDMSLTYYTDGNRLHGIATLTVEVSVMFFSTSVSLTVQRDFAGSGSQTAMLEGAVPPVLGPMPVAFADQMSATDWQTYCQAFA